jgi:hypothetical protein
MLVFLIPFVASLLLVFLQNVFVTYSRDIATGFTGFDIKLGIYWFSYKVDDADFVSGKGIHLPYTSSSTVLSYGAYCSTVPFQTRYSNGEMIDYEFFCKGITWRTIQYVQGAVILFGVLFIILLIDNVLVWQGYSWWFHPTRNSDASVRRVRKFFKILIQFNVLGHFVLQLIVLYLLYTTFASKLIKQPDGLHLFIGFYGSLASCFWDVVFLVLFTYSDQLIFFHVPLSSHKASARSVR